MERRTFIQTIEAAMATIAFLALNPAAVFALPRFKHESQRAYRLKYEHSTGEQVYAEFWERKQHFWRWRSSLASSLIDNCTQRDAEVAATIIQWLGTSVGSCFVWECEREIQRRGGCSRFPKIWAAGETKRKG